MSKIMIWCSGVALIGAVAGCGQAAAVRAAGSWDRAIEVPGLGALNTGGHAYVTTVSCASAGNCAIGGSYRDRHRHDQGFVADERNGRWGTAIEVPGLGALNTGRSQYISGASVSSVSCAAAGNCAAGGYYVNRHNKVQAFVADERHGRWGRSIEVPGLGALNVGGFAGVNTVSCSSAGNCAAGGSYANDVALRDAGGPFVAIERGGRWRKAVALRADGEVNSISCLPAGTCLAGGEAACENCYYDIGDAFVVEQRAGRWLPFRRIPGLLALEHHGDPEIAGSQIDSLACPTAGNCAVSGSYIDKSGKQHAFVAVEQYGRWGNAIQVPGLAALSIGGHAEVSEVSCGSAGDCTAGGYYTDRSHHHQGFVAVERNGR